MTKDEALRLALEALNSGVKTKSHRIEWIEYDSLLVEQAITAIKEALAQPEQCQCPNCKVTLHASDCAVHNEPAYPKGQCNCGAQPEQEPVVIELLRYHLDAEGHMVQDRQSVSM